MTEDVLERLLRDVRPTAYMGMYRVWGQIFILDISPSSLIPFFPMARPLRIQYENACYHVTCRGNDRQHIFRADNDRKKFLDLLAHS